MSSFKFKQFVVNQDKAAMKVGTDGVLLGAWARVENSKEILDIGSGTGLISLMCAQRSGANISTIEIDQAAFDQSIENFESSPWNSRIKCFHTSLQEFRIDKKFDHIISNPPFFEASSKTPIASRTNARHTDLLNHRELLKCSSDLLSNNGKASFIIPYISESKFIAIAESYKLYPSKICRVRGKVGSEIKRSLIEFSQENTKILIEEMAIEIDRHIYTSEYINLTNAFYLKM